MTYSSRLLSIRLYAPLGPNTGTRNRTQSQTPHATPETADLINRVALL